MTDAQKGVFWNSTESPKFRAANAEAADAILAANAEVFDHCRAAQSVAEADWGIVRSTPGGPYAGRPLGHLRDLGRLPCLRALRQADVGDAAGAVDSLRMAEALSRALGATACAPARRYRWRWSRWSSGRWNRSPQPWRLTPAPAGRRSGRRCGG